LPLPLELARRGLRAEERSAKVHVDHLIPELDRMLEERRGRIDARVVHEDVDPPEPGDGRVDRGARALGSRHVGGDRLERAVPAPAQTTRRGARAARVDVVQHDRGAGLGEAAGDAQTDARARARDHGDLLREVEELDDGFFGHGSLSLRRSGGQRFSAGAPLRSVRAGVYTSITRVASSNTRAPCAVPAGIRYVSPGVRMRCSPAMTMASDPLTTTPNCSTSCLCVSTTIFGSRSNWMSVEPSVWRTRPVAPGHGAIAGRSRGDA